MRRYQILWLLLARAEESSTLKQSAIDYPRSVSKSVTPGEIRVSGIRVLESTTMTVIGNSS